MPSCSNEDDLSSDDTSFAITHTDNLDTFTEKEFDSDSGAITDITVIPQPSDSDSTDDTAYNEPETEGISSDILPPTEPKDEAPKEDITPAYNPPEGWYSPRFVNEKVSGGDYKLEYGVMGLKVYYVQKKLGVRPRIWGYYYESTMDVVAYFQGQNGLDMTGEVDLETWLALGFSKEEWNELGAYVTPVESNPDSTTEEMREIIVCTAEKYLGTPYVVGASGKPGEGVDCSGLALQCMYAVGIYPDGLDPVQHATVEEYNSRLMWADPKLKEIPRGDLQPGDLVFYSRPGSRVVCHVAVYVGDDECIEALSGVVERLHVDKDAEGFAIVGFKTIFSDN